MANERALARIEAAGDDLVGVILVEGVSDQIAVETLAARLGRNLADEVVVVLPVGGAGGLAAHIDQLAHRPGVRLAGLVDAAEAPLAVRAVEAAGLGPAIGPLALSEVGFQVCVDDLEDELISAVGMERIEELLAAEGELRSYRTLQRQPNWRDQPRRDQLRRFFGSRAGRKSRYARAMITAVDLDRVPTALRAVLDDTAPPGSGPPV